MTDANKRRLSDRVTGPATVIAEGALFEGNFSGTGSFVVGGRVEGDADIDGTVVLSAGGQWHGSLQATDLVIAGRVEGDVLANRQVEVTGTGHVTGRLSGRSVAMAEGAVVQGEVSITGDGELRRFRDRRRHGEGE